MKRQFLNLIIFGCLTFTGCNSGEQASETPPNIVIIFSDELAPKYLGCYGGDIPTPNIDKLATNGIRFTKTYTPASMCTPSRFALITGQFPGRCTGSSFLEAYPKNAPYSIAWNTAVTEDKHTIARALKKAGYTTGAVGKWHIGMGEDKLALNVKPDADLESETVNQKLAEHQKSAREMVKRTAGFDYAASILPGNYDNFPIEALAVHNFEWMTEGALRFFEEQQEEDKPFFLYVATTGIHGPRHDKALESNVQYTIEGKMPELAKHQSARDQKLKEIAGLPNHEKHLKTGMWFLDEHVKAIVEKLKALGMYENTAIFFMADHNVEPGKATCYDKGNRVPFLIHWPSQLSESRVEDALVENVDILPTAVDMASSTTEQQLDIDGVSLLPLINGEKQSVRRYAYLESGYTRAITDGRYKYIAFRPTENMLDSMKSGEAEFAPNYIHRFKQSHSQIAMQYFPAYFAPDQLYDLKNDPYEQNNLAENAEYQEIKTGLKVQLESILTTFDHPFSLEADPFMYTDQYREMAENTRDLGTDFIPWWGGHHGTVIWPPEE